MSGNVQKFWNGKGKLVKNIFIKTPPNWRCFFIAKIQGNFLAKIACGFFGLVLECF